MTHTMVTVRSIWTEGFTEHIEVGPDADGLGLVEVRQHLADGTISDRLVFPPDMARIVAAAMLVCADELERGAT